MPDTYLVIIHNFTPKLCNAQELYDLLVKGISLRIWAVTGNDLRRVYADKWASNIPWFSLYDGYHNFVATLKNETEEN